MRIAYFDCFSGASGDMILGALIDAGVDFETLRQRLAGLGVGGYSLAANRIRKQGFGATKFDVDLEPTHDQPHRHLKHIREIIESADLDQSVKDRAIAIFTRLAEAEAHVHGSTVEKVHFHEVGAVDAIVDVVGASLALELLGVDRVICSPVPTGNGTVKCDHGLMPVPAPATAELLRGVPIAASEEQSELTTPTGAAILTTVAQSFGSMPAMTVEAIGIGAGGREGKTRPNVLRVFVGETAESDEQDEVVVIEANIDDQDAQVIGFAFERLLAAGALDVYATPIFMKKNRPGTKLSVIVSAESVGVIEAILFAETTTFGLRRWTCQRSKLQREHVTVDTPYGPVRVKLGRRGGDLMTASPEYEDCRAVAMAKGVSLRVVMAAAMQAWHESQASR